MKKFLLILLTAILALSMFISCERDPGTDPVVKITITFDNNGGAGDMAVLNVNKGEEVKLTANEFTLDYYVFTGWNTAADGSGTPYKDEATVKFDKDTTLYAQWWQPKVTFKENGATSGTMPAQSVGYNTATKLSANVFKRTEYVFLG